MSVVFTKVSANRVKVDVDGKNHGFNIQSTNVFEHPFKDAVVLTNESDPNFVTNGIGNGLIIMAKDVTTPANTGKRDLVDKLITDFFN